MAEQWLAIPGFPGYAVSDAGRVFRFATWSGYRSGPAFITGTVCRGYVFTKLKTAAGRQRRIGVHRLVMLAFCGPSGGRFVCHRNGEPSDNRLENLYYGTARDNSDDRARHGRTPVGSRNRLAKLDESKVSEIRVRYARGGVRQLDLAHEYGVTQRVISLVVRREAWTHVA